LVCLVQDCGWQIAGGRRLLADNLYELLGGACRGADRLGWQPRVLTRDLARIMGEADRAVRATQTARGRRPELFEVVVGPHGGLHDMHHDVARIHQHPLAA